MISDLINQALLDGDQTIIDVNDYLSTTITGDPNTGTSTTTAGPGGSTVTTPTITDDQSSGAVSSDPVINDPNNVATIDDYTPETDPYSCS